MDRTHLQEPRAYQYALLTVGAVLVSVATALGVVFLLRRRTPSLHQPAGEGENRSETAASGGSREEQDPIQPAVDTVAPAEVPHHFTETLLVPGYTFTGEQILEQDDADGRSPEGV